VRETAVAAQSAPNRRACASPPREWSTGGAVGWPKWTSPGFEDTDSAQPGPAHLGEGFEGCQRIGQTVGYLSVIALDSVALLSLPSAMSSRLAKHRAHRDPRSFAQRARDACRFAKFATREILAAKFIPGPKKDLAPIGTRVEVMRTGGKPPPPNRYSTGTITRHEWDSDCRTWRVDVTLDQPAGTYYGQPVKGVLTNMYGIHVIGGPGRPFSTMTPTEIEQFDEQRRQQFWRNIDPRTRLTDPAVPRND